MALIGSIRKNGWILIVLMTLALGGFILMEFISNMERNRAGDVNTVGKINGQEIRRDEFDLYERMVYANTRTPYQARAQSWNYFVENALVKEMAEQLGLGVPVDELKELQFGDNLSPIVAERMKDASGQIDRQQLAQIKAAIENGQLTDPNYRAYWAIQEKEVIKARLQEKMTALVENGLYAPAWQAEMTFREANERLDFKYVRVPYDKVNDSEAQLTDDDYKAFLRDFPGLYDQTDETRVVNYVVFDVVPTSADSSQARDGVSNLIEGLRTATNDSLYAVTNKGLYDTEFRRKDDLPVSVADTLLKIPVGTVVGPFFESGYFTIAKVVERRIVPDSVRARHILIRENTPESERKIDSLRALIESGRARFDSLAARNSQDPGSGARGGDLGYMPYGRTVAEFNDVLFNTGVEGKLYKVSTQFGWHLIEITGKKTLTNEAKIRGAFISLPLEPSDATEKAARDRAAALSQQAKNLDDLNTIAGQQGVQVQTSQALKANDFALGAVTGDGVREAVRWAFDDKTEVGNVSKEVFSVRKQGAYFDEKYIVAGLKSIAPAGEATVATLKSLPRLETEIRNRKKADIIKSKAASVTDLGAYASQWGVNVDTAKQVTFLQAALPGVGAEPRVYGAAFSLPVGSLSGQIAGASGVYVVQPLTERSQLSLPADLSMFRRQAISTSNSAVRMNLMSEIKKKADIRDNRSRFF